jgi:hypothetical protein
MSNSITSSSGSVVYHAEPIVYESIQDPTKTFQSIGYANEHLGFEKSHTLPDSHHRGEIEIQFIHASAEEAIELMNWFDRILSPYVLYTSLRCM